MFWPVFALLVAVVSGQDDGIYVMQERSEHRHFLPTDYEELRIFCHAGQSKDLRSFWSAAEIRLKIESESYNVYLGENSTQVLEMHQDHQSSWFYSSLPWKSKSVRLNPFQNSCLGVLSREEYSVTLLRLRVNYWQVLLTFLGMFLFWKSKSLCRNVFFHYTTGVGIGVFLSLMAVSFLIQRKFNLGKWILACYSLSLYFVTSIWYNIKVYLMDNHVYVLGYLVLSALVSFAVCYRMGPVENPRTLNLIQWTMQLVALVLIYSSSYHRVASLSLALGILGWSLVPDALKTQVQVQYHKKFVKPKIRLLSEAEYLDQSRIETEKALKDLRSFCQSPKCDAWKHISTLKSPTRFAQFVQGNSHLTQEEVMDYSQADFDDDLIESYEDEEHNVQLTDDDSSDD